ncbi:MAG TPA: circadian clock KaiB family protein [Allocoleopsis sp.]
MPQEENNLPQADRDDTTASFEQALANQEQQHYYLRLYIAGTTARSRRSLENLKTICETHLQGRYELEVVDVYQAPAALQTENLVALPTLVKQLPPPLRRLIGDLSDTEKVLLGLDLVPK